MGGCGALAVCPRYLGPEASVLAVPVYDPQPPRQRRTPVQWSSGSSAVHGRHEESKRWGKAILVVGGAQELEL